MMWDVRCDGCQSVIAKTDDTMPRGSLYCVSCADRRDEDESGVDEDGDDDPPIS